MIGKTRLLDIETSILLRNLIARHYSTTEFAAADQRIKHLGLTNRDFVLLENMLHVIYQWMCGYGGGHLQQLNTITQDLLSNKRALLAWNSVFSRTEPHYCMFGIRGESVLNNIVKDVEDPTEPFTLERSNKNKILNWVGFDPTSTRLPELLHATSSNKFTHIFLAKKSSIANKVIFYNNPQCPVLYADGHRGCLLSYATFQDEQECLTFGKVVGRCYTLENFPSERYAEIYRRYNKSHGH